MYRKQLAITILLLIGVLALVACGAPTVEPGAAPTEEATEAPAEAPTEEPGEEQAAPEAALAALERIAAETGLALEELEIVSWSAEEWSDSCLGLGGPAESCLQAITPGYLVVIKAGETLFNVRTDESGAAIRIEELTGAGDERPGVVEVALQTLAAELEVPLEAIEVVSFEQVEWSDSCLGLGGAAESCLQAITPGWRVILSFDGAEYEIRTDETGEAVRVNWDEMGSESPAPELGEAVVQYERSGGIAGEVVTVRVFADGRVERSGALNAPSDAVERFAVESAAVEQLLADLEAAGYFDLAGSYVPKDTCCDRFLYVISARPADSAGDSAHTVEALLDDEATPPMVWESIALVEAFIEEAAAAAQ